MKLICTIKTSHLLAAQLFVARKDIRPQLKGAYIAYKRHESGDHVQVCATDGHTLFVAHNSIEVEGIQWDSEVFDSMVSQESLSSYDQAGFIVQFDSKLPAAFKKSDFCEIYYLDGGLLLKTDTGQTVSASIIKASFSDIDPVLKRAKAQFKDESPEVGDFDPELLDRFSKAGKLFGSFRDMPKVHHRGLSAALVVWPKVTECFGVIMPVRLDSTVGPECLDYY